ncbi:trypsin-like peptidase domain-containing protein [Streptomyces durmitorensis]
MSERHVLTCAHVVRGSGTAPVTVSFPHRDDLGEVTAAVGAHGGWDGRGDDLGDLAVLELEHAVPVRPAEFAAPEDAYAEPRPRLLVYGFPKGYREGTLAEYRATAAQRIADEWVQLEAWSAHGQPLAPGFSGAAVTLADSNRVVGMVSAATRATSGVRNGRMLPTSVMARYWPPLGDLVPTPGHHRAAKERLRALVDRAAGTGVARDPERLYRDAVGPFGPPVPPEGFGSLWSAAWYVLSEVEEPDAVTRLADRLAGLLEAPATPAPSPPGECGEPGASGEPGEPGEPRELPVWSPILIEIDHSGAGDDQLLVEVSAYREGLRHPVGSHTVAAGHVRRYVQERVDDAFSHLTPGTDELLAFVLPRALLNWPVAQWECGADDPTPLGCSYPLVVTDRSRRKGGLRHRLARKWEHLDERPTTVLHRVECGTQEKPNKLRFRLRRDGADLAGFAAPPRAGRAGPDADVTHFDVSLTAPVPVLVWPRTGCDDSDHHTTDEGCAGSDFLDRMAAHVDGHPPAELPRTILTLRESAEASDEPDTHWARDVQLLWDDPRCFPDAPAAHRHSPVA